MRGKALVVLALAALLTPLAALPAGSTAFCFGLPTTMSVVPGGTTQGTAGDDVILGTAAAETIYGNGGKDRLCGGGGNDRLYGGLGRDRLAGDEGDDLLNSGAGKNHVLNGGDGNDTIRAQGYGDTANGGRGNDTLISANAFLTLNGNAGDDNLISDYRNGLDAGGGRDRCTLALGVPGTGCEQVELACGTGGDPLPVFMLDETSASGDFDGNGIDDMLYVWKDGTDWLAQVQTDGGFGAQTVLPTSQYEPAKAIGGHDVNGDGMEEAFLLVGSGASSEVVGLYTLHQPDPDEIPFYMCGLEEVLSATWVIDGGLLVQTGLQCRGHHYLRDFYQETADGISYSQNQYNYDYLPNFAVAAPTLSFRSSLTGILLVSPTDDTLINLAGRFTCGGLSLAP
jgi:hypothetical protein